MDAFDVLGFPPSFALDGAELEARYRELQRQLHPDKFAHASSAERRASLSRAVAVNEAYRVLKDPLERAELLLARHILGAHDEPSAVAEPALLTEMMELREALADARAERDRPSAERIAEQVRAREASAVQKLEAALAALQGEFSAARRDEAKKALHRLRYYRRFFDELAAFDDELSD